MDFLQGRVCYNTSNKMQVTLILGMRNGCKNLSSDLLKMDKRNSALPNQAAWGSTLYQGFS